MNYSDFIQSLPFTADVLWLTALAFGAAVAFAGFYRALGEKDVAAERMGGIPGQERLTGDVINGRDLRPTGLAAGLVPDDEKKRLQISRELRRAGFRGPGAVRNFYLVRFSLALLLPLIFFGLLTIARSNVGILPDWPTEFLRGLSGNKVLATIGGLCFIGYAGPGKWLNGRIQRRREDIEQAFPNALDLLQISVEAGLGFDAAMTRVAHELAPVAPALSEEFLIAQGDIQAGRERGEALLSMARRVDIDTVTSFASVVLQSIQFGTSMADALTTYSKEMRLFRELKAQEKANQLPVKMSAVLASLMLPSIILISLGPVVIRYIRYFG